MNVADRSHCLSKFNDEADIVVIGACLIEHTLYVSCFPNDNTLVKGYNVKEHFSGKGANQCVAAAKLGASVALISKVGNDTNGKRYLDELRKYPINTKYVRALQDVPTGVSTITIDREDSQRTILVPGVCNYLSQSDIEQAKDVLVKAKVILFQGEIPWETILYCLSNLLVSSQCTSTTVFNPSPAVHPAHPMILLLADIVCLNEEEAGMITNMKVKSEEDLMESVNRLIFDKKCNTVIVTVGRSGVVYASKENPRVKTVSVDPLDVGSDARGVGDCFVGALVYYLCCFPQLPLGEQIKRAAYIARQSLYQPGLQESFPTRKCLCDLNERLFHPFCSGRNEL